MQNFWLLHILTLSIFLRNTDSCLFKQATGRRKNVPSYMAGEEEKLKPFERPLHRNSTGYTCACANAITDTSFLFVVFRESESGELLGLGSATLIASNLLLTSNQIFLKQNHTMLPYDAWTNSKGIHQVHDLSKLLLVHNSEVSELPSNKYTTYKVKTVVINPGFASSSQKPEKFPVDDVALIVSEDNLLGKHDAIPACLPESDTKYEAEDLFYRQGIYDGVGGMLPEDPTVEDRTRIYPVTLRAKDCFREAATEFRAEDNIICARFRDAPPLYYGGSLMILDKLYQTYLVGVASKVGYSQKLASFHYAYFTNLLPLLKYIEKQAAQGKSLWCTAPQIDLKFGRILGEIKSKPLTFEGDFKPEPRNESLDCFCGIKNSGQPGRRKRSPTGRIAGGEEAINSEFPWMVQLHIKKLDGWVICGGSLINDRMVLTAAHCVVDVVAGGIVDSESVFAFLLEHKGAPTQLLSFKVHFIQVHPDYIPAFKKGLADSDIAILITLTPITLLVKKFTPGKDVKPLALRPICLPKYGSKIDVVGKTAVNSGWGLTDLNDEGSQGKVLKKITLPILPLAECIKNARVVITENVICAGYQNITQSSAPGDSGGPLILENETTQIWTQIGLVSFDSRNVEQYNATHKIWGKHPAFYVNLQNFTRYIDYVANLYGAQWCKSPE